MECIGLQKLRTKFPGLIRKIGADGYMNPEDSRTGNYLAQICREISNRYNVDGIHLDYIRYPETWNIKVSREQGRRYITNIVQKINDAVKSQKPWIKMSCSPVGKYDDLSRYWSHGWNANTKVCQDAQGWLRDGLMDELFPMMYFRDEHFYPLLSTGRNRATARLWFQVLVSTSLTHVKANGISKTSRQKCSIPATWEWATHSSATNSCSTTDKASWISRLSLIHILHSFHR